MTDRHADSIQIRRGEEGRLIVLLPYTPERVAKIKTVAGRRWHQEERCWTVPQTNGAIAHLLTLFAGEPVEMEPSLHPARHTDHREPLPEPETLQTVAATPQLLDQVRRTIRTRHYRYRTEEAYVGWVRRFVLFHGKRPPAEMGAAEVSRFLTSLAVDRRVASSTQNQALAALLFLYKDALDQDPGRLDDAVHAKRPQRLPVVLTRQRCTTCWPRLTASRGLWECSFTAPVFG